MLSIYKKIDKIIKVLTAFTANPFDRLSHALENNTNEIEDYQKEQFDSGERSDFSVIEPDYTIRTKIIKQGKGQPIDRVTLKDTGAFYKSITADVLSDEVQIYATDRKTKKLVDKYDEGGKLFGLNNESLKSLADETLIPYIAEVLKLDMND